MLSELFFWAHTLSRSRPWCHNQELKRVPKETFHNRQIWLGERGNRNISQNWLHFWKLGGKIYNLHFSMPIVTSHLSSQFYILINRNGVLRNISPKRNPFWTPEEILHRHKGSLLSYVLLQRLSSLQWLLWQTGRYMCDVQWHETELPTSTSQSTGDRWAIDWLLHFWKQSVI